LWKGSNIHIIPNGVDLNTFKPLKHKVNKNIRSSKKVLFISDKLRSEKNYYLLKSAVHLLKNRFKIEIINPTNLTPVELNKEYNSAHVLTLTSIYEGSPNVIKEAMACNLSIVSTDIGDVRKVIGETAGCYIAKNNSMDYSEKLTKALQFKGSTKGRERIINLGLDSKAISERLINLYQS